MENPFNIPNSPLTYQFIPAVNKGMTTGSKWVIVMHGLGDNLHSYIPLCHEINVTGLNYILVNAPLDYPIGYSWYDLDNPPYGRLEDSREHLRQFIEQVKQQGIETEDLFIMGFSQGGLMALDQFLFNSDIFAGIIALSPRVKLPSKLDKYIEVEKSNTPIFIAHGEDDPQIPFTETFKGYEKLSAHMKDISFKSYHMGHTIDIDEIRDLREWLNDYL